MHPKCKRLVFYEKLLKFTFYQLVTLNSTPRSLRTALATPLNTIALPDDCDNVRNSARISDISLPSADRVVVEAAASTWLYSIHEYSRRLFGGSRRRRRPNSRCHSHS